MVGKFAALVLLLASSVALADPVAIARLAPASVTVDGDLTEWNIGRFSISPPVFFGEGTTFTEVGVVSSNADHSARIFIAHRKGELLIAALVRDDSVVTVRAGEQWRGDGLELLFPRGAKPMLHVGVNPVGDVHVFSKQSNIAEQEIKAAARAEAGGWAVELRVPLASLESSGTSLPFNLAMRDVDVNESVAAHRVWSGQRHGEPGSAGTLMLDQSKPVAVTWPSCAPWGGVVTLSSPLSASGEQLMNGATAVRLRLINFQSSQNNWKTFWSAFDEKQISNDLDAAQKLRANAIRIFVFDEIFGIPAVEAKWLERLHFVVREAAKRGLVSVVSFFPFKKEFRSEWHARMRAHLEAVVVGFKGDPAIAMWDLMNEPDHAWKQSGTKAQDIEQWAKAMYSAVKAADPTHLITVGTAGHAFDNAVPSEIEALRFVDVQSVHWYGEKSELVSRLEHAKGKAPVVLQEFGATSLYLGEAAATELIDTACAEAKRAKIAGVGVWELFDHPVGSIGHQADKWLETPENDFGLITADGRPKAQAAAFCRCLSVPQLKISK